MNRYCFRCGRHCLLNALTFWCVTCTGFWRDQIQAARKKATA